MVAESVGTALIKLGFDAEEVKKGVNLTQARLKSLGNQARESANKYGKAAAAIVAGSTAAAAAIVRTQLTAINELNNLATAANTSVESFQRLSFAANSVGISQEKYGDILKDVNDRVGDFLTTGAGPITDFFEKVAPKVGVTAEQFKGLSGPQALQLYVSSLQQANLSQEEMTFHMEAMASDSTRLLPLLKNNGEAMRAMAQEAKDLGIGLDAIDVEQARRAEIELSKISTLIDTRMKEATIALAPFITEIAEEFLGASGSGSDFGETVIKVLKGAGRVVGVFADGVHGLNIVFNGLKIAALAVTSTISTAFAHVAKFVYDAMSEAMSLVQAAMEKAARVAGVFSESMAEKIQRVADGLDASNMAPPTAIYDAARSQVEALELASAELKTLMLEQLPSEQIAEKIEEVERKALASRARIKAEIESGQLDVAGPTNTVNDNSDTETGETTVNSAANMPGMKQENGGGFLQGIGKALGFGGEQMTPGDKIRSDTEGLISALQERFMTENELQMMQFQTKQQMLEQALANEEITKEQHAEKLADIEAQRVQAEKNIAKQGAKDSLNLLASNSKTAEKAMRGFAVGRAIIQGGEAAIAAWNAGMSTGGPWAPVVAAGYTAASLAKTGAMISSLRSGGKASGGGGGGVASAQTGSAPATGSQAAPGGGSAEPVTRRISISMQGVGPWSTEQVRGLIDQINEELGQGAELRAT